MLRALYEIVESGCELLRRYRRPSVYLTGPNRSLNIGPQSPVFTCNVVAGDEHTDAGASDP